MELPKFNHFLYEERGPVAIFTANRPEVLNALNYACWDDLAAFAEYLDKAGHLRCAIITGAGDKAFIAGADVNNINAGHGVSSLHNSGLRRAYAALENCSKPVICAVNGYCLGGGLELACACDIRVASENASFGLPETKLGILPGAGGTQRLSRLVGLGIAKDVVLAGRILSAQEAYQYGLVMKVVPKGQALDAAMDAADKVIKRGPVALDLAKKVLNASMYTDPNTGIFMESLSLAVLMETQDRLEGSSAFLEKRQANFKGE